jgi:hypothetical protein
MIFKSGHDVDKIIEVIKDTAKKGVYYQSKDRGDYKSACEHYISDDNVSIRFMRVVDNYEEKNYLYFAACFMQGNKTDITTANKWLKRLTGLTRTDYEEIENSLNDECLMLILDCDRRWNFKLQ